MCRGTARLDHQRRAPQKRVDRRSRGYRLLRPRYRDRAFQDAYERCMTYNGGAETKPGSIAWCDAAMKAQCLSIGAAENEAMIHGWCELPAKLSNVSPI